MTISQLQIFDALEPDKVSELLDVPAPKKPMDENGGDQMLDDENFAEVCYICKQQRSPEEEERMLVCDECDF